jgi:SAM-dependent methyltransferase
MAFKAIDPIDYLVRSMSGLSTLPRYSIRVRSNGVTKQFGGRQFATLGKLLADQLTTHASVNSQSRVLEIGCGCGRTAYALAATLDYGNFVGMDVEKVSLRSCQKSRVFSRKGFRFDYLDVQNDEYNPAGKNEASTYIFSYDNRSFDAIFLVSVFTHMLTDDVEHYIDEISRMLRPGGTCMITAFLMDKGRESDILSFPLKSGEHYYFNEAMPEVAIGYSLGFLERNFTENGVTLSQEPLWGDWRGMPDVESATGFSQDILFFRKPEHLKT